MQSRPRPQNAACFLVGLFLLQFFEFEPEDGLAFWVGQVLRDAIHRANGHALRLIEMADAFCAQIGVDEVMLFAHADGLVGALRLADIAVDAVAGDF